MELHGPSWDDIEATGRKMIAQGASEIAHALYTGNAYVAYGATERSAGVAQPEASEIQAPSYDDLKAQVAQAPQIEPPQQEMER